MRRFLTALAIAVTVALVGGVALSRSYLQAGAQVFRISKTATRRRTSGRPASRCSSCCSAATCAPAPAAAAATPSTSSACRPAAGRRR